MVVEDSNILKVSYPAFRPVSDYEPTRIHVDNEYLFLETIYSPLIDLLNDKAVPMASIAKEHYWKESELHLVIRDDLKTVDGTVLNVDDVIMSLKRVLILAENTHGDFKKLICPEISLKSLSDECSGISKEGNTLILKPVNKRDFLVPMLASIDFAIIPISSVDDKTLKIIDYKNTSGPYYVDKDLGDGNIVLKANPNHFQYSEKLASEVHLVPTRGLDKSEIVEMLKRGDIDAITTIDGLDTSHFDKAKSSELNIHQTINIKSKIAFITESGLKNIPKDKRISFAKKLRQSFHERYKNDPTYKLSDEYFLPFSDGGITEEREKELVNLFSVSKDDLIDEESIYLSIFHTGDHLFKDFSQTAKKEMPKLLVDRATTIPAFNKNKDYKEPDYIFVSTDTGFLENISLISYSMSAGIFGFSKKEGIKWLHDYMATEDRNERLKKLKQMHYQSLSEGRLIPLLSTSYVALSNKKWNFDLSELFANCPLWKIKKN